jgi:squalene-associated FAD-dependent desaturase
MQPPRIHIVGAGLSGLASAVALAEGPAQIFLYEAARQAGGRCRSYEDAQLGMTIDNGNHLLLSGNASALEFLTRIGARDRLHGPEEAKFPFADVASGKTWTLHPGEGRIPFWLLSPRRKPPGTRLRDWLRLARLMRMRGEARLDTSLICNGRFYEAVMRPLLVSALNTDPPLASRLLTTNLLRESLARGGRACHPLIARRGLGDTFIEPALSWLNARHTSVQFERRLRQIHFDGDKVSALEFTDGTVPLAANDVAILTIPANGAQALVPDLVTPDVHNTIVNVHFAQAPPKAFPPFIGILNGTAEWIFGYADRLSATISAADHLDDVTPDEIAQRVWQDIRRICDVAPEMPPWRVLRERRATFAATPEQNAKRPKAETQWRNLLLAGDWTSTGLPATIEGAIRSGDTAATIVRAKLAGMRASSPPSSRASMPTRYTATPPTTTPGA